MMVFLYNLGKELIEKSNSIIAAFRCQDYDRGNRLFAEEFTDRYQKLVQEIGIHQTWFQQKGFNIEIRAFVDLLKLLLEAQQRKDCILLADYLELKLLGLVEYVLEAARMDGVGAEEINCLEDNRKVLERLLCLPAVKSIYGDEIRVIRGILEQTENFVTDYVLEVTQQGPLTLKCIREEQNQYYLHSNVNPWKEADCFADTYGRDDAREYAVLGLGLGYHAVRLWERTAGAQPVHIYESNRQVLFCALRSNSFRGCLGQNFYIHYDPEWKQLRAKLREEGCFLTIHHPSLRGIMNPAVRELFEEFFLKDSSERCQRKYLYANFMSNISGNLRPIEEIRPTFEKKTIYIVAAGPSLDKNVMQLKNIQAGDIILATATVARKLFTEGVGADYIIATDANERVVKQIRNSDLHGVPLLLLATANYKFKVYHKGRCYIFFQKDFSPSEEYAGKNQRTLFLTGGSVVTSALDIAIRFGAERIVFLGLDLAYTDNLAHASGTSSQIAGSPEQLKPVRGYYGDTVYSDAKFILFRKWIEERIQQEDAKRVEMINATEGGCYIEGMSHRMLCEVLKDAPAGMGKGN